MSVEAHQLDEDGDHNPDECELCFENNHAVCNSCRCGNCCQATIIEVSLRDAEREPRIAAECGGLYDFPDEDGTRQKIGYLLNDKQNRGACHFFDRETRLCTIHPTRPLVCRVFDCNEYEHRDPQ